MQMGTDPNFNAHKGVGDKVVSIRINMWANPTIDRVNLISEREKDKG